MVTVACGNCKTALDELPNTPLEARTPCPVCGATSRLYGMTLESTVNVHSKLAYKAKRGGRGKAFIEGIIGDDLFRKIGRWMHLERVIDREKDWYKEVVTDPETGQELHRTEEPLSQHHGHGDARKNKPE